MVSFSPIPHLDRQEGRAASSKSSQFTDSSCASNASRITPDFEKENVHALFELGDTIDKGEHWEMVKAAPKAFPAHQTQTMVIKKFGRWHLRRDRTNAFLREVDILRKLSHPKVLKIHHFFPREFRYYYVVLEHLEGGDLLDHIGKKDKFDERMLWTICYTIIDIIFHVHKEGIVHRDINLRSFVLAKPGDERSIRLTGFGEACSLSKGPVTAPIRWYPHRFAAPEMVKKKPHGTAVDMWNIGHVVYVLLTGNDLYFRRGEILVKTKKGNKENRMDQNWGNTSEEAKGFILKLLEKDPNERMTAEGAAMHEWIRNKAGHTSLNNLTANIKRIWLCDIIRKCKIALRLYLFGRLLSDGPVANLGKSEFKRAYEIQELLGEGSFSRVHKVRLKEGGAELEAERAKVNGSRGEGAQSEEKEFAAKRIWKGYKSKRVFDEACILKKLEHENVVKIHEFYTDDAKYYYIVLDLVIGGDLFHHFGRKTNFNEKMVRDICSVLFKAVEYIHSEDIVHRDLKPENILLASEHDSTSIRIVDFGLAWHLKDEHPFDRCGTARYMAPEVIKYKPQGKPVDMWSMGVIVYIMFTGGEFPFGNCLTVVKNPDRCQIVKDVMADIERDSPKFEQLCWNHVSEEAKNFIGKLLTVDPSKRLTASEAGEHPWLKIGKEKLASDNLTSSLKNLQVFNARRRLRGIISTFQAAQKMRRTEEENLRRRMTKQPHLREIHE